MIGKPPVAPCSLALILLVSSVVAAPLNYNEDVAGDLPGTGAPLPIFDFRIGENTIAGTLGRDAALMDDFDSFAFFVPEGATLVTARVEMTDFENNLNWSYWRLFAGTADWNLGTLLNAYFVDSPGSAALASPLGPGLYNVSNHTQSYFDPSPATANYVFTFTLVPEQASAAMFVIAIVTVSIQRGRRWR